MALYVNNKEIENVYFKDTKIERVFANGKMVYEATIYVDKPTVTGEYTYNTAAQAPTISGYDEAAMTISGTQSATEAGTYHVYFTLNKGYAWKDGTTNVLDFTWTIAKRSITIPTLSATSFTWLEGNTHTVTVSGLDTTYASQTGNLSQTDSSSNIGTSNVITWALKNIASCVWSDGTTGNKTASWKAAWVNGTSHYKTDLYNSGWNSGRLKAMSSDNGTATIDWGSASKPYFTATGYITTGFYFYCPEKLAGNTFHVKLKTDGTAPVRVVSVRYGGTGGANVNCDEASDGYCGTDWGEIWGKDTAQGAYYGGCYGTRSESQGKKSIYVQRVWLT